MAAGATVLSEEQLADLQERVLTEYAVEKAVKESIEKRAADYKAGVEALAKMPSLDELRGRLVGLVQAPAGKLARVAQAPAGKVARVIQARADQLQQG